VVAVKRDLAVLRVDLKDLVAHKVPKLVHREHLLHKAHAQKILKALRLDLKDKLLLLRIVTAKVGQRDLRLDLKDLPLKVATAVVSQKDLAVLKVDLKAHKVALA
jgi:hypothetical protein